MLYRLRTNYVLLKKISSLINFPLLLPNNKTHQKVQSKTPTLSLHLFIYSFKFGFYSQENRQEAFKNLKYKEIQQLLPI